MIHTKTAVIGLLCAVPFLVVNAIVATRFEPFYSVLGNLGWLSFSPIPLVLILIFIGLVGAFIAASPMIQKGVEGKRKFYAFNAFLALLLFAAFVWVGIVLGEEIYRCDILKIPNCD